MAAYLLASCGQSQPAAPDGAPQPQDDAQACSPQSATGDFYRRAPSPRLVAGAKTFADAKVDTEITDPDLWWDEAAQRWSLFYASAHGTFGSTNTAIIRRASSVDLASWTFDDEPALTAVGAQAWDALIVSGPSIAYNPDAPAERRYALMYSGAARPFPFPSYLGAEFSIGVAFSSDGILFARLEAADSPKGKAGLVLEGADIFPGAAGAIAAAPELVFVGGTYHLWFSSFACTGAQCATVTAHGISHATSTDAVNWTIEAAPVPSLLRQSATPTSGGTDAAVVYDNVHCRWELWLTNDSIADVAAQPTDLDNSVGVWHATSSNGKSWTINYAGQRDLGWNKTVAGETLGLRKGIDVATKSSGRYMAYVGYSDQQVPNGATLPARAQPASSIPGIMTLNIATRDAQ